MAEQIILSWNSAGSGDLTDSVQLRRIK